MTVFIRRHARLLVLRVPLALAFVLLFLWRVDEREMVARVASVDPRWVVPGLLMFTASKAIHAYRWQAFLRRRHDLPFGPLFAVFLLSNLGNALIPFRAGDLLRIEIPARRFRIPRAELASTVLLVESVLDGVAFAILFGVAAPFLDIPAAVRIPIVVFITAILALFVVSVGVARTDRSVDFARAWPIRWLSARPRMVVARTLPEFISGMASLESARSLAFVVVLSCLSWIAEIAVYWTMGQAFGLSLSLPEATVVMMMANLIVSVPITPWDIGPYEVVVTETLVLLGVASGIAGGYALGSHLLLQVWIGVTGAGAMIALDLRPRDLVPRRSSNSE